MLTDTYDVSDLELLSGGSHCELDVIRETMKSTVSMRDSEGQGREAGIRTKRKGGEGYKRDVRKRKRKEKEGEQIFEEGKSLWPHLPPFQHGVAQVDFG